MSAPRSNLPFPPDDAVESAAAEWLVRHDRGLIGEQQDAFLQWLAASPAHRESFQRHQAMWRDFNALAQWRPEHSAEPNPDLLARPARQRLVRHVLSGLLVAAAVAITFILPRVREKSQQNVAFEASSYRQETLPDGSIVDLNRGSHVVVQFSAAERRAVLVQGEAQFTVAKNPARPFVVRAGGVDVRAVGTAFNVKLAGATLEVLVTEGEVHVMPQAPAPRAGTESAAPTANRDAVLAKLQAGERTSIPVASFTARPRIFTTSEAEIERLLAWKPRLLDFDSTPLEEVVASFNRANVTRLTIGDEALRGLPIIASIRSDNLEGFVRLLEATMGVRAEREAGEIVLRQARR